MPVKRSVWTTLFSEKYFPGLPCPECDPGKLKLVAGSYVLEEPEFSKNLHKHNDWEPEWVSSRFSARMKCDELECGEIIFVAGETEFAQVYSEDDEYPDWSVERILRAKSVFPAPPLFRIPKKVPYDVKQQLKLAFQIFWSDLPSSVGRLRTAVELMLDDQKIPKEKLTKKSKTVRMDLAERIEVFAATATGDGAKEALHGLRYIGNLGTHGGGVTDEAIFDAADVLEDILLSIYEKKSITAKIKKLNDKKGKY